MARWKERLTNRHRSPAWRAPTRRPEHRSPARQASYSERFKTPSSVRGLESRAVPAKEKGPPPGWGAGLFVLAERTGLEPATPGVTGRYSNQLNYRSEFWWVLTGSNRRPSPCKGDALPAELSTRFSGRTKRPLSGRSLSCASRSEKRRKARGYALSGLVAPRRAR